MTKKELLKKIDVETVIDFECKRIIERIKDTLSGFDDKTDVGEFASIKEFINNDEYNRSVLDGAKRNNIAHELDKILTEIQTWVLSRGQQLLYTAMDRKTHIGLKIFLTVIILIALAAIGCTLAHVFLGDTGFPYGESVSELIGMCDFVLGVIGFVWERRDDLNKNKVKREINSATEQANRTGTDEDYRNAIKIINEEIKNSAVIKGKFNWFNRQTVNNN